uniref:Uncharacterized protein n=1 Tax=Physcomitrium patens TaxID=3218 RepID=A0A2K1KZV1_PHYPA|nr:hypothetical protein PHYPA_002082 [Physcomitrium patens]
MKIGGPTASVVRIGRRVHKSHVDHSTLKVVRRIRLRLRGLSKTPLYTIYFFRPLIVTSCRAKYISLIVEHLNKWIEFMALPQNSSKLLAMTFLIKYWYILECFLKS